MLREKLPYYAYKEIDRATDIDRRYAKELFRITNYTHPANCIAVSSATAAQAMKAARPAAPFFSLETGTVEEFAETIAKCGNVGLLYIGQTTLREVILETALAHTNNRSAIIVEGIDKNKASREWWQQIINDPRTIVTYDMHRYGLILFDDEKKKQNYKLKR